MKLATHMFWESIAKKAVPPIVGAVVVAALLGIAANAKQDDRNRARPQVNVATLPGPAAVLPDPPPVTPAAPLGPLGPQVTRLPAGQWIQWAFRDHDGIVSGSPYANQEITTTESMVKAWLAADYLARNNAPTQSRLEQLRRMIRDSNDKDAQTIYMALGGEASIRRMIEKCGLHNTLIVDGWWSRTQMTAFDAVAVGACIAGGAAGPKWTSWLLGEMRQVRGEGRFGIVDGLPATWASSVSIKNGWTAYEHFWTVNCLAVSSTGWVLAVLQRFPIALGLGHGAKVCADVATQLVSHMHAPS